MKVKVKIALAALAVLLPCGGIPVAVGQIFNDPLHQLSNLLQFTNSLETAIQSVEGVEKIWNAGVETTEHLQGIRKTLEKVNEYLKDAREMEESVRDLIEMTDMVTATAKQIQKASSVLSWEESIMALDMFSSTLVRATNNVKTIYDICREDSKLLMSDAERLAAIARYKLMTREEKERMLIASLKFKGAVDERRRQKKAIDDATSGIMGRRTSVADLAVTVARLEVGEESSEVEQMIAAASAFLGDDRKPDTEGKEIAVSKVKGAAGYFFDIYYAVCGLMGLIGAYKVYSKVQHGEEFGRSVGTWLMSALLAFFMGVLVQEFFFS